MCTAYIPDLMTSQVSSERESESVLLGASLSLAFLGPELSALIPVPVALDCRAAAANDGGIGVELGLLCWYVIGCCDCECDFPFSFALGVED